MKYHILNLIFMTTFLFSQPPEDWCLVLQTNTSGVFQGIATVDGVPAAIPGKKSIYTIYLKYKRNLFLNYILIDY